MAVTVKGYSDFNDVVKIYTEKKLLKVAMPQMNIATIAGQDSTVLPLNSGHIVTFRRYNRLPIAGVISEGTNNISGVADGFVSLNADDYQVQLYQYGSYTDLSDKAEMMAQDNLLNVAVDLLGKQYAETIETVNFNVLKTSPQQFYANRVAGQSNVATKIASKDLRDVTNFLARNNAEMITEILSPSVDFNTVPVKAGYIALCHTDLRGDLFDLPGFIPTEKYTAQSKINDNEIGAFEHIRFLESTIYKAYGEATNTATGATVSDGSVRVDGSGKAFVYPVVILGRGAFNTVAPKGVGAVSVQVSKPEVSLATPYANVRVMSWNTWHAICVTNPLWIATLNVAKGN